MLKPLRLKILMEEICKTLQPITDTSRLEAELLIAHVLQQPKSYLYTHAEEIIQDAAQRLLLHNLVARRLAKEPLAYLLGEKEFWLHRFQVNQATLIPRPETECVVEQVFAQFSDQKTLQVADLGTGCGAIALSLAASKPQWIITASDKSEAALEVAKANAKRFALSNVHFILSDWCQAYRDASQDVIISNPPYISEAEWDLYKADLAFEPQGALLSGPEGLDAITTIVDTARNTLKKGGYLFIEHGYQQGAAVRALFARFGYEAIRTAPDLGGRDRLTYGKCQSSG